MKVYIGKYKNYVGPYQIGGFFKYLGATEAEQIAITKLLLDTWVERFCEWLHEKRSRRVKIKLHPYDTWSLHNTTSLIIHPLLVQLKETNHGYGMIHKDDIPNHIKADFDEHGFSKEAWNWVMEEMIWAFDQDNKEEVYDKAHQARMRRGFELFGKYYQTLWD